MVKIPLLLLFLGHVWVDASQGILPVVIARMKDLFELTYFQVGLMVMVLNLTSSVIQPVFGILSDRVRVGWFVPVGILWTSFSMGLLGWAPNYAVAVLLVGFSGLGTAAFHPRAMMAVALVSGARRGLGAAIFSTGGNIGFAIGPLVGGLLVLGIGLHATVGLLLPGMILFLLISLYKGDFLRREVSGRSGSRAFEGGVRAFPWISLLSVCGVVTLRSWAYISFISFLPLFLQERGFPLAMGSLMLTVFLSGGAAAGLLGGHLSDRIGRKEVIFGSFLLYPLLASLMIVSNGPWVWLLAGAAGAALLASFSVTVVLMQELLPRNLGLASGLVLGLGFGTGGLGAAFSGFLADQIGLQQTVWVLALVPSLAALLAIPIKARRGSHQEILWSGREGSAPPGDP
jgi:MFS transporter, FSR family, fosmidomycin resistance protein